MRGPLWKKKGFWGGGVWNGNNFYSPFDHSRGVQKKKRKRKKESEKKIKKKGSRGCTRGKGGDACTPSSNCSASQGKNYREKKRENRKKRKKLSSRKRILVRGKKKGSARGERSLQKKRRTSGGKRKSPEIKPLHPFFEHEEPEKGGKKTKQGLFKRGARASQAVVEGKKQRKAAREKEKKKLEIPPEKKDGGRIGPFFYKEYP